MAAVFNEKGLNKGDHLEIAKLDFIGVLKDSGILIIQKLEKAEEGKGKAAKQEGKLHLILNFSQPKKMERRRKKRQRASLTRSM